jgi:hypothetical protein
VELRGTRSVEVIVVDDEISESPRSRDADRQLAIAASEDGPLALELARR